MDNYKIIKILKKIDEPEMRLLAKFIKSPLHNRHSIVQQLFSILRTELKKPNPRLDEQKIYQKLYPKTPFDVKKLHHVNSYLLKTVESFLAWLEWQSNPFRPQLYLIQAFRKLKMENPLLQHVEKASDILEASPLRNARFHTNQYYLELEKYRFQESLGRTQDFNLQELSNIQDISFIAEKLKSACVLLSHQSVAKKSYDTGLLNSVLVFLEKHHYIKIPAIGAYYHGYQALSNIESDIDLKQLKGLLLSSYWSFDQEELRDLYLIAINCCIRRMNLGKKQFIREGFELYRSGLEQKVFVTDGTLSSATYSNIIAIGLLLKEYDWVEQFIYDFKPLLPARQKEGFFNFNLSKLLFEKGDYNRAMPLLLQMEYEDPLHNLSAKSMLAKMYYELKEVESLEYLLSSLKTYIYRKQGLGYHKDIYLNFIQFLNKIIHSNSMTHQGVKELSLQINQTKALRDRDWLLKQLEHLKK